MEIFLFLRHGRRQIKWIRRPGGKLLFTSPPVVVEWDDAMTDLPSRSLGAERYKELMSASGLSLIEEFEDEGENHYFHAIKL